MGQANKLAKQRVQAHKEAIERETITGIQAPTWRMPAQNKIPTERASAATAKASRIGGTHHAVPLREGMKVVTLRADGSCNPHRAKQANPIGVQRPTPKPVGLDQTMYNAHKRAGEVKIYG